MFLTISIMQHIIYHYFRGSGIELGSRRRKEKVVIVARISMMF